VYYLLFVVGVAYFCLVARSNLLLGTGRLNGIPDFIVGLRFFLPGPVKVVDLGFGLSSDIVLQ